MSSTTNIEWCDSTFNPWIGCTKVSPACDDCYAARSTPARALGVQWGAGRARHRTGEANWSLPERWQREAAAFHAEHGRRRRVFCASLADVFDNEVPIEWRRDLFSQIELTPDLDWLLLTKRIGNVQEMVRAARSRDWLDGQRNVWLGATVVNQAEADRDIPKLLAVPARVRFLSIEPMLGPVDLGGFVGPQCDAGSLLINAGTAGVTCPRCDGLRSRGGCPGIDWVIAGGESGPKARPMHVDWVRSLRDQCAAAGVPFLFKQWGEWVPYEHAAQPPFLWSQHGHELDAHALPDFESDDGRDQQEWHCDYADQLLARRVGKKAAGRLLDGVEHNGFPEVSR